MLKNANQILVIEQLCHKYNDTFAIQDINIEINQTGILGLLGSNGAGKSTTMNIMCGVLNQTSGNVLIGGDDIRKNPESAKKKLGFLPQSAPLYLDFTVDEYLKYCAHLRLIDSGKINMAIERVKERCGIANFSKRLIKNLSGGYRQRVGIAQAIVHQPKLVVLDEPTNGLDPNQILEVRSLIKEIASERAVIFSSHILTEVQVLCDNIIMIEGGKIVFSDTMESFNNYVKPHSVTLNMQNPPTSALLLTIDGVTRVDWQTVNQARIYFSGSQEIAGLLIEMSVHNGWGLQEISIDKSSIEEVFAQLSKKD